MTRAMAIERGSTWNKWDFHVHTPYSLLNNGFGLNLVHDTVDGFDKYVKELLTKAVEYGIVAIGITDYFSVAGYKHLREAFLSNEEKMKELFPDDDLRKQVENVFIFPNIEFRLDTFIGKDSHAVNYHVIFSNDISANDIEENFLHRLNIPYESGTTLPLTVESIRKIGYDHKKHNDDNRDDLVVGLEKATVNYQDIISILTQSAVLRDKYMISIPVDEDLSKISWDGRDSQIRKILYQQADLLMTSNPNTRKWALAKGNEQAYISEFRSLKPCIWGSDAHDYKRLFIPEKNRFCWLKAEPTFEGLRQILYEPEDRVRIQPDCPDAKDAHQIIDHIVFKSDAFPEAPIFFNEGLNAIIGGKSTGKSILLRHIAKNIDIKQVHTREEQIYGQKRLPLDVEAEVRWKDGASGDRKIIYIPQSWLNRTVDEFQGNSQLNTMLHDILVQQETIRIAENTLIANVAAIIDDIKHNIIDYITANNSVTEFEQKLKENGRSEAYASTISELEKAREEMSSAAGLTDEMLQRYTLLEKIFSEQTESLSQLKIEEAQLDFQLSPFIYVPGITQIQNDSTYTYSFDKIVVSKKLISDAIDKINKEAVKIWSNACSEAQSVVEVSKSTVEDKIKCTAKELSPLKEHISQNEILKKIDAQLHDEKIKQKAARDIEIAQCDKIKAMQNLKQEILTARKGIKEAYEAFKDTIAGINIDGSNLRFDAEILYKQQDLFDAITGLFNNKTFRTFKDKYHYTISTQEDFKINDGLFTSIWDAMENGDLNFKAGNNIQSALERLFSDWMYVHFIVKSGNDEINNMSPGKKALVLLEMIVNLEKSKCPILIDQPEDDLDNRSIYSDLVQYLRKKKSERQIIVVTHNANIVVGADAEEVIIANQNGEETRNQAKRFEYRCGAIENTMPVFDADNNIVSGILNQKGIKEQICDILEGGTEAFELRHNKYFSEKI